MWFRSGVRVSETVHIYDMTSEPFSGVSAKKVP